MGCLRRDCGLRCLAVGPCLSQTAPVVLQANRMNHPDIRDLENLLGQLRERHTAFFYTACVFTALGVLGLVCLWDALFPVKVPQ